MPITKDNLATAINLLNALSQRQDTIRQLAAAIGNAVIWRSPDGTIALPIPPAEIAELETFLHTYLNESQVTITALRAMLAEPKP